MLLGIANLLGHIAIETNLLLTPKRVRSYSIIFLVFGIGFYAIGIAWGNLPFDAFGHPIAADFPAQVTAGHIALTGDMHRLYDLAYQWKIQQQVLGSGHESYMNPFLSPPFVAYVWAPFAALPYLVAVALWTALTLIMLVVSLRLLWPLVPNLHRYGYLLMLLVIFSAQPVFELLADGQDSAISILLLVVGFRLLLVGSDLKAGALLGLGVFKPQLFILMPVLLLIERRWRALAAWTVVALALTSISIALVGFDGVNSYVSLLTSDIYRKTLTEGLVHKMHSPVGLARALLPASATLYISLVSVISGIAVLLFIVRTSAQTARRTHDIVSLYVITVLIGALINPHFLSYDAIILLLPIVIVFNAAPENTTVRLSMAALYALTWTDAPRHLLFWGTPWPLRMMALPWTALPLFVLLIAARRTLQRDDSESSVCKSVSAQARGNADVIKSPQPETVL